MRGALRALRAAPCCRAPPAPQPHARTAAPAAAAAQAQAHATRARRAGVAQAARPCSAASRAAAPPPRRRAPFSAAAAAAVDAHSAAFEVQTPLCEQPAEHEGDGAEVATWLASAHADIAALGPDGLAPAGGGPTGEELRQELTWLLQDAVAACRPNSAPDAPWRDADGAALLSRHAPAPLPHLRLRLRAPLPRLRALWTRRVQQREPFQYLVGAAHWRDLVLAVGPGVLIPRPETETLLDAAQAALTAAPALAAGAWADAGTGSGAIAVALARLLPSDGPPVAATDVSVAALAYAAANAARAGVADRVVPMRGEWLAPLLAQRGPACLAGVISNPPYIPSARLPGLQPEVGRFEPALALDGGAGDGADALRAISADAAAALQGGGFLALETDGWGQGELVAAVLEAMRAPGTDEPLFERVAVMADYAGVRRFVTAWRTHAR